MFVKVKSSVFIDALRLQFFAPVGQSLRGILRDDSGIICRTMEKKIHKEKEELTWEGLNDLPYGRYTLELTHGEDQIKMDLVKRI